jgi:hypothetical protein
VPGGGCAASSGQRRNDLATQRIVPGRGGNAGIRCTAVVRRPESGWAAPEPSVRLLPCFVSCMGCCVSYLLNFCSWALVVLSRAFFLCVSRAGTHGLSFCLPGSLLFYLPVVLGFVFYFSSSLLASVGVLLVSFVCCKMDDEDLRAPTKQPLYSDTRMKILVDRQLLP